MCYCRDPYPPEAMEEIKLDIEESRREYSKLRRKAEAKLRKLMKVKVPPHDVEFGDGDWDWDAIDYVGWERDVREQDTRLVFVCREEAQLKLLEQCMSSDEGLSEYEATDILLGGGKAEPLTLAWDALKNKTVVEAKMTRPRGEEGGGSRSTDSYCCSICMKEMEFGRVTTCSHTFHGQCLFEWLSGPVGSQSGSCPICTYRLLRSSPISSIVPRFYASQLEGGRQRTLPHNVFYRV